MTHSEQTAAHYYTLGAACWRAGRHDEALAACRKVLEIEPGHAGAGYTLGVILNRLGRTGEAIAAWQALLSVVPGHADALNDMGAALMRTGERQKGMTCFEKIMAFDPAHKAAVHNLLRNGCLMAPMTEWAGFCDGVLARPGLTGEGRHAALIHRSIAAWMTGAVTELPDLLRRAADVRPVNGLKDMMVYETFLGRLAAYRSEHPALYEPGGGGTLYMAGDSHSLSFANVKTDDGVIAARLIVGAKAWHIASSGPTNYTLAFDDYIAALPESAVLACVFGEIDCRVDEGILPHWKEKGGDLAAIVNGQARRYVATVATKTKSRRIVPVFVSVPAPHPESDRRDVVRLFNTALREAAAGHRYVDLYAATCGPDGYGRTECYIDRIHLKPEVFALSPAAFL